MTLVGCVSALPPIDILETDMLSQRFLVMPLAFGDAEKNSYREKTGTIAAALALIGSAFALSFILVCAQYHQRTYLLHSVFL
jgi:hypothetical protein